MAQCALCGVALPAVESSMKPSGAGALFCCDECRGRFRELGDVHRQLDQAYDATLEALVAALDIRERKTAEHSRRVACYSRLLASELNIPGKLCHRLCRGALLHDIGKIGVPDAVLLKEGPLTEAEWTIMRRHPEMGATILEAVPFLADEREIVLTHQERYDGSGYPAGLRGEAIPIGARIFAVADTLDALRSDRPYHRAVPFETALTVIRAQSGTTLDPAVVAALVGVQHQFQGVDGIDADVSL
jgi:putative nucleotidyltransferase with HDIG domain